MHFTRCNFECIDLFVYLTHGFSNLVQLIACGFVTPAASGRSAPALWPGTEGGSSCCPRSHGACVLERWLPLSSSAMFRSPRRRLPSFDLGAFSLISSPMAQGIRSCATSGCRPTTRISRPIWRTLQFRGTDNNSSIPVGQTYVGQLLTHDISKDEISKLEKSFDPDALGNRVTPWIDLDVIYEHTGKTAERDLGRFRQAAARQRYRQ